MIPRRWGGAESSSKGTITTSTPPEPAPAGGSEAAWETAVYAVVRPSSTVMAVTSRGGATDSSTAEAIASPSSTCAGSGSAHGGWGQGSEDTIGTLWAKRFRGARLNMLVSVYLREDRSKVNKQSKSESLR
jgi:hypothetical protein